MIRLATLAMLLVAAAPAAAQVGTPAAPGGLPTVKASVTVSSDLVRVGDLIENAGAVAGIPIFRSPDLGTTGTIQTARVIEAARPHGLAAVDTRGIAEITVTRASRVITAKDIEALVARAIAAQAGSSDRAMTVTLEREMRAMHVEPSALAELQVTRLVHDPRSGRFDISFDLPGSNAARKLALRFTGSAIETVEVAVPVRPLARGDLIRRGDVVIERKARTEAGTDALTTIEQAVGHAARRGLRAGQPLRAADVMKPDIVLRNEPVVIVYEMPGMLLTVRGKAMDSGAEGDVVNVTNVQSKRTLQGVVVGPGRVAINAGAREVAAAEAPETTGSTRPQ